MTLEHEEEGSSLTITEVGGQQVDRRSLLKQAEKTYRNDLPWLRTNHLGKWVAYCTDSLVGLAATEKDIIALCNEGGFDTRSMVIRKVILNSETEGEVVAAIATEPYEIEVFTFDESTQQTRDAVRNYLDSNS